MTKPVTQAIRWNAGQAFRWLLLGDLAQWDYYRGKVYWLKRLRRVDRGKKTP